MNSNAPTAVSINEHAFAVAGTLPDTMTEAQKKHFVAAADFLMREVVSQLGQSWEEILRVAKKTGEGGDKGEVANFSLGAKFDVSNLDLLHVEMKSVVSPWKLEIKASAEEDLRQIVMDFDNHTLRFDDSIAIEPPVVDGGEPGENTEGEGPEFGDTLGDGTGADNTDGATPPPDGKLDYASMDLKALKTLAKDRNIKVTKGTTGEEIVSALQAQDDAGDKIHHIEQAA